MSLAGGIVALDAGDLATAADLLARRLSRGDADGCSPLELRRAAGRARIATSRCQSIAHHLEKLAREAEA